jgi:hypothetical protein
MLLVLAAIAGSCTRASSGETALARSGEPTSTTVVVTVPPAPSTTAVPTTTTTTTRPPPQRLVFEPSWTPFGTVGGLALVHPARRVERVGFHQSNHEGAQQFEPLPTAVNPTTLESRERLTGSRTAADVVVDPEGEIRAPITGVVKRAGTYVLYCDHSDDFVVIAPDGQPSWEVKLLHIDGVQVRAGQRVVAGETVLAPRPTRLPFASQVDEVGAQPPWPHVHIEVVDPTIRDRPTGPGCT